MKMEKELVKINISVVDVDIFRSQSFPYFALNYCGVTFLNEVVNQNLCLIGSVHQHVTLILSREPQAPFISRHSSLQKGGGFRKKRSSVFWGAGGAGHWSVKFPSFITEYRD